MKYGIVVPRAVKEFMELNYENWNNLRTQVINKEIIIVRLSFRFLEEGESPPVGS